MLHRHAAGFDPRDLAAAGRPAGRRRRATSPPGAAAVRAGAGRAARCSATSSTCAGPPGSRRRCRSASSPRGATALLAAARAWAWLSGRDYVTPDDVKALARPTLRHRVAAAARGRAGGRHRRRRARRRARLRPGPRADRGDASTVAVTGRARAARRCSAALLVGCRRARPWLLGWTGLLRRGWSRVDVALAGSPAPAAAGARPAAPRSGSASRPRSRCWSTNPGRRRVRGVLRDAWPPSRRRCRTAAPRSTCRRASGAGWSTALRARPGAATGAPTRVTVRSLGPLGLAARQRLARRCPWRVRVLPPFTSRKHLPAKLARLRELDGRTALLVRGQGTEFDSLREYVRRRRRALHRLAGHRPARATSWCAPGARARPPRAAACSTPAAPSAGRVGDAPRLDAAMDAALLLAALATRAGDRVDLLAVRPPGPGAGCEGAVAHRAAARRWSARWRRWSRRWSRPTGRRSSARCCARTTQRALVVLLTALDAGAGRGGAAAGARAG